MITSLLLVLAWINKLLIFKVAKWHLPVRAVHTMAEVSLSLLHLPSPTLPLGDWKSGLNDWGKHRTQSFPDFHVLTKCLENADSGRMGVGSEDFHLCLSNDVPRAHF